jgi:hypothetical protein
MEKMASIREGIDSRLPYRIGYPKLPVLPVETAFLSQSSGACIPDLPSCWRKIDDVLAKYHIPQRGLFFAYRLNRGVHSADCDPTLVIVSTYRHSNRLSWVDAVCEICADLHLSGIKQAIELIDEQVFYSSLSTSAIQSTETKLIKGWEEVLPNFLAAIKERNWITVDVLYREFPSRVMQPTVIINAQDANDDIWWGQTLPALFKLLRDNQLEVDIVVLFLENLAFTADSASSRNGAQSDSYSPGVEDNGFGPDPSISDDFYEDTLQIGTSCGTSSSISSGTLGGRILLQKDSHEFEVGLTNYHVLKDAFTSQGELPPPFPPNTEKPYQSVTSPSNRDHENVIHTLRKSLHSAKEKFEEASEKLEFLTKDVPSWDGTLRQKNRARKKLDSLKDDIEDVENYQRHIGQIYAASGYRTCEIQPHQQHAGLTEPKDWALDWCLVHIDQPKSVSSSLKDVPSTARSISNHANVTRYCSISSNINYRVMKRGSTTGWTTGHTSAIPSAIRMQDQIPPQLQIPTAQAVVFKDKWGGKPVFVHTIVGTKKRSQFLEPGDSGSLILLDEDSSVPEVCIIGLGFAANETAFASYMIPIDRVMEDIETVTGAKVTEPRRYKLTGQQTGPGN